MAYDLITTIGADISGFQAALSRAEGLAGKFGRAAAVGVGLFTGAAAAAIVSASNFESAFAGVVKTVDATDAELAVLRQGIRDMATEIPATTTEIAGVAEAAGQLGIQTENILGFTRTMIDMGQSTNLAASDAATALARFANITQMSQTDFDRLGSTIVDLGNNLATTEAEIVNMGMRIAGAGTQIGLTQPQIMAMAGALSSVGLHAEMGGSAMSRLMLQVQDAVMRGGADLQEFAGVARMTGDEFKTAFEQDAARALTALFRGFGKIKAEGGNVSQVLEGLGIASIRMRDTILRASNASNLMEESLVRANTAWNENTALTEEASRRYETFASRMGTLRNRVNDVLITIGDRLIPYLDRLITWGEEFVNRDDFGKYFTKAEQRISDFLLRSARMIDQIQPSLLKIWDFVNRAYEGYQKMPAWMQEVGLFGALVGGWKGKVLLVGMASLFDALAKSYEGFEAAQEGKIKWRDWLFSNKEELEEIMKGIQGVNKAATGSLIDISNEAGSAEKAMQSFLINAWSPERVEPFVKPSGEMMLKAFYDSTKAAEAFEGQAKQSQAAVESLGRVSEQSFADMAELTKNFLLQHIATEQEKTRFQIEENLTRLQNTREHLEATEAMTDELRERLSAKEEEWHQQLIDMDQQALNERLGIAQATTNAIVAENDEAGEAIAGIYGETTDEVAAAAEDMASSFKTSTNQMVADAEEAGRKISSSLAEAIGTTIDQRAAALGLTVPEYRRYLKYRKGRAYQSGTHYVEETGPALVHRGELIVPAAQNPYNPAATAPAAVGGGVNLNLNIYPPTGAREDRGYWEGLTYEQIIPAIKKGIRLGNIRLT